ncbi:MAG: hypothetical protein ACREXW_16255 [Gammaproteobacteria bacterium]
MPMLQLDNLVPIKKLKAEPATEADIEGLLRSGKARLDDAAKKSLSPRVASTWRTTRRMHSLSRHRAGTGIGQTIDTWYSSAWSTRWIYRKSNGGCSTAHNKRNVAEYKGDLDIDPELLEALLRVAREVHRRVSMLDSPYEPARKSLMKSIRRTSMPWIDVPSAALRLMRYATPLTTVLVRIETEPVIVTSDGIPIAALVPIGSVDLETMSLSTNAMFIALIERSRARHRTEGGISSDEMRRRLGEGQRA